MQSVIKVGVVFYSLELTTTPVRDVEVSLIHDSEKHSNIYRNCFTFWGILVMREYLISNNLYDLRIL